MAELSDFQKRFLAVGQGQQVFTQREYDNAVAAAKAEIITVAIEATKYAISVEREECALLMDERYPEGAQQIRDRALIAKH
ncbi:hypothetical protein UFOVP56_41 [uncultured Caudovirales phage]|uniref:Uncharacterized protein n=1 Tax=uncultured Caudovirales phage TaxID=2100421 RepID=A0A6J5T873_9CAUD|nr:hypothetical protein UFOVP56_41 [uncultured Caudovirales phage]